MNRRQRQKEKRKFKGVSIKPDRPCSRAPGSEPSAETIRGREMINIDTILSEGAR